MEVGFAVSSQWLEVRKHLYRLEFFGGCPCQDRSGRCPVWSNSFLYQSVDSQLQGVSILAKLLSEKARPPPLLRWLYQPYRIQKHIPTRAVSCLLVAKQQWESWVPIPKICSTGKALESEKGQDHVPNETCCQFFDRKAIFTFFYKRRGVTEDLNFHRWKHRNPWNHQYY